MLLKLDFAKAYDMLDWNFQFEVFIARNFEERWIQWMHNCVEGAKSLVLINGTTGKIICPKRGLR